MCYGNEACGMICKYSWAAEAPIGSLTLSNLSVLYVLSTHLILFNLSNIFKPLQHRYIFIHVYSSNEDLIKLISNLTTSYLQAVKVLCYLHLAVNKPSSVWNVILTRILIPCVIWFQLGGTVEVKHPETGNLLEGLVKHINDSSMYTVGMYYFNMTKTDHND